MDDVGVGNAVAGLASDGAGRALLRFEGRGVVAPSIARGGWMAQASVTAQTVPPRPILRLVAPRVRASPPRAGVTAIALVG